MGTGGTVEGRNKVGTWIAFKREIAAMGLATKSEQEERGLYLQFPRNKRDAFNSMTAKPDGSGFILWYRFHT